MADSLFESVANYVVQTIRAAHAVVGDPIDNANPRCRVIQFTARNKRSTVFIFELAEGRVSIGSFPEVYTTFNAETRESVRLALERAYRILSTPPNNVDIYYAVCRCIANMLASENVRYMHLGRYDGGQRDLFVVECTGCQERIEVSDDTSSVRVKSKPINLEFKGRFDENDIKKLRVALSRKFSLQGRNGRNKKFAALRTVPLVT